jgi:hypothetical protein
MAEDFEHLLTDGLLEVPDDFAGTVMARIDALPLPEFRDPAPPHERLRQWLQYLALGASAVLGAVQLGGFMFGIWAVSTAG